RNLTPDPLPCEGRGDREKLGLRLLPIFERDLDILRQLEILVGHAARVVCRADKRDARVVDVNVRMMVGAFRDLGDLLHELDSMQEFLELEHLADRVVFVFPSRKRLQFLSDFIGAEFRHVEILRTLSSFIIDPCERRPQTPAAVYRSRSAVVIEVPSALNSEGYSDGEQIRY